MPSWRPGSSSCGRTPSWGTTTGLPSTCSTGSGRPGPGPGDVAVTGYDDIPSRRSPIRASRPSPSRRSRWGRWQCRSCSAPWPAASCRPRRCAGQARRPRELRRPRLNDRCGLHASRRAPQVPSLPGDDRLTRLGGPRNWSCSMTTQPRSRSGAAPRRRRRGPRPLAQRAEDPSGEHLHEPASCDATSSMTPAAVLHVHVTHDRSVGVRQATGSAPPNRKCPVSRHRPTSDPSRAEASRSISRRSRARCRMGVATGSKPPRGDLAERWTFATTCPCGSASWATGCEATRPRHPVRRGLSMPSASTANGRASGAIPRATVRGGRASTRVVLAARRR